MKHVIAWRNDANCIRADAEVVEKFFPTGRPATAPQLLCDSCPVRRQCLEFALESPWRPAAIVAGLTPGELEPLWRKRHPDDNHSEIQSLLGLR